MDGVRIAFFSTSLKVNGKRGPKGKRNREGESPTWEIYRFGKNILIFDKSGLQEVAANYPPLIRPVPEIMSLPLRYWLFKANSLPQIGKLFQNKEEVTLFRARRLSRRCGYIIYTLYALSTTIHCL